MNYLITFATEIEAEETLKKFNAKKINQNTYSCYFGTILITGMGPEITLKSLQEVTIFPTALFNIGICGALHTKLPSLSSHTIESVHVDNKDAINFEKPGKKLITLSKPLHDENVRDKLAKNFDLVDMEGYVIAKWAQEKKLPCFLHKVVSDYCSSDTMATVISLLPKLTYELAILAEEEIRKFSEE